LEEFSTYPDKTIFSYCYQFAFVHDQLLNRTDVARFLLFAADFNLNKTRLLNCKLKAKGLTYWKIRSVQMLIF